MVKPKTKTVLWSVGLPKWKNIFPATTAILYSPHYHYRYCCAAGAPPPPPPAAAAAAAAAADDDDDDAVAAAASAATTIILAIVLQANISGLQITENWSLTIIKYLFPDGPHPDCGWTNSASGGNIHVATSRATESPICVVILVPTYPHVSPLATAWLQMYGARQYDRIMAR